MPASSSAPSAAILKMKSPTGVSDFVQVDQQSMQKDLNSSFSWVDPASPTPVKVKAKAKGKVLKGTKLMSSTKKKTTATDTDTAGTTTKKKTKTGTKKTTSSSSSSSSSSSTAISSMQEEIQQAQKRLKWLEAQRVKDQEDYQDQLRNAKSEVREALFSKFGPLLNKDTTKYDGQVLETTKIISYLREDNARLREEMKGLKKGIQLLKQKNQELEAANASAHASYQDLLDHVEGLTMVQGKLQSNVKVFKQALSQMKQDYVKRTSFYNMEYKTVAKYEQCIAKVLTQVQNANNPVLLSQLYDMAGECATELVEGRETALAKAGLAMDAKQQKQVQLLLDPELMIAEQRRKNNRSAGSDDDDDSSSDDSSDSDDDDSDFEQDSSSDSNE